jgi:beta-galactosidase
LVENTGRVNYGREFVNERAGITKRVTLGDATLTGWQIYPLPMEDAGSDEYDSDTCTGACFYRGEFYVTQPADTFVDMRQFGKGVVWINGRLIGRFWNIGPQRTLYVPSTIIAPRRNDIEIFDLNGQPGRTVRFLNKAILDDTSRVEK